jgi:hypothetical protein
MKLLFKIMVCSIACLVIFSSIGFAADDQTGASDNTVTTDSSTNDATLKTDQPTANTSTTSNDEFKKSVTRYSILGGTIPVVFAFGAKTWSWGDRKSPRIGHEGWFGEDTNLGGADKAGHCLAHYIVQRSLYSTFNWTENGGNRKWVYSIGTTMTIGLFIEIGDSFTSKYGFSFEDLTVDYIGILIGAALDYSPIADGFIGLSGRYIPTKQYKHGFRHYNKATRALDFVDDYSGWTYFVNFKLAGFERVGVHLPLALRLIQFDFGYRTKGYCSYDRERWANPKRERDIVFGISLNSAQLLEESWGSNEKGGLYNTGHKFLEYYHVPIEKEYEHAL